MTDLEMTKLCAEAMGLTVVSLDPNYVDGLIKTDVALPPGTILIARHNTPPRTYFPLHDDAQAMALVKRFRVAIGNDRDAWFARPDHPHEEVENADLNRAIVECVAKMQREARSTPRLEHGLGAPQI